MTGPIIPAPPSVCEGAADELGAAAELDDVPSDEPPQAVSTPAPPRAMMLAAAMVSPRRAFERMSSYFLSAPPRPVCPWEGRAVRLFPMLTDKVPAWFLIRSDDDRAREGA